MGFTHPFAFKRSLREAFAGSAAAGRARRLDLEPLRPRHPARDPQAVPLRAARGARAGGPRAGLASTARRWCSGATATPTSADELRRGATPRRSADGRARGAGGRGPLGVARPARGGRRRRGVPARLTGRAPSYLGAVSLRSALAVALTALALLTACGGDDEDDQPARDPAPRTEPGRATGHRARARRRGARGDRRHRPRGAVGDRVPARRPRADHRAAGAGAPAVRRTSSCARSPRPRSTWQSLGEGGLLGLAVDPQFARNSFVYALPHHRLAATRCCATGSRATAWRRTRASSTAWRPRRSTTAGASTSAPTGCCT